MRSRALWFAEGFSLPCQTFWPQLSTLLCSLFTLKKTWYRNIFAKVWLESIQSLINTQCLLRLQHRATYNCETDSITSSSHIIGFIYFIYFQQNSLQLKNQNSQVTIYYLSFLTLLWSVWPTFCVWIQRRDPDYRFTWETSGEENYCLVLSWFSTRIWSVLYSTRCS